MMTAEPMLLKRPVLRFTVAFFRPIFLVFRSLLEVDPGMSA